MPRTKRIRKSKQEQQSVEEIDLLIQDFNQQAHLRILRMEAEAEMEIKSFEKFIDIILSRFPLEIQQMTLAEIFTYETDDQKENCNKVLSSVDDCSLALAPRMVEEEKTSKRITAASDDGYVTEGVVTSYPTKIQKDTEVSRNIRTRSNSRASKIKLSEVNQETVKKTRKERGKESMKDAKFKTPATQKLNISEYGLVTPKVKPNTPLNVLRRPRHGEMVLSMQGSPLFVSTVVQEDIANVNVPLSNGNIMSLLPKDGLRMSHIPQLDSETMQQLETLKKHIEKVISIK
ncbi:uncharacterized protein LOC143153176 [Ptiloglossa arizonensis]|uniref:uncharacterized protein LOC143153176 n=1 Tax=Ptiloglossa arizonensis TaxID=3350558 RepID=UPI003FA1668C